MRVLSLCDYSGVAVHPWVAAGYSAEIVDLEHETGRHTEGRLTRTGMDVRFYEPPSGPWSFVYAWPPCTAFATSGARWFKGKGLRALADGIAVVAACAELCERIGAPYCIENPVGTLSTYWRDCDYTFAPWEYAGYLEDPRLEGYAKRTCLWTGGGFVMPEPRPAPVARGSLIRDMSPSDDRPQRRSLTPLGFSRAVFAANSHRSPHEL